MPSGGKGVASSKGLGVISKIADALPFSYPLIPGSHKPPGAVTSFRHRYNQSMSPQPESIATEELGAQGAAVVDRMLSTGQPLTILRDGKPIARLVPVRDDPRRRLRGSIVWQGDVISPIDEKWDAEQ